MNNKITYIKKNKLTFNKEILFLGQDRARPIIKKIVLNLFEHLILKKNRTKSPIFLLYLIFLIKIQHFL